MSSPRNRSPEPLKIAQTFRWLTGSIRHVAIQAASLIGRYPVAASLACGAMALSALAVTLMALRADMDLSLVVALSLVFGVFAIAGAWVVAFAIQESIASRSIVLHEARIDLTTGLDNRRSLGATLDGEWQRARRTGSALSVLLIDIDNFRRVSDLLGHDAGDDVLVSVAARIRTCVGRSPGMVARYGAEEFAVLLPGASAQQANALAEYIRQRVESLRIQPVGQDCIRMTVSVGCASCFPRHVQGSGAPALINAADQQKRAAKAAGRNCVRSVKLRDRIAAEEQLF